MKNLIIITVSILLDESYFKFTSLGHFGLVTILLILFRTSSGVAVSEKRRNTSPEFHEIRLKMSKIPMLISQKLHNSHGTAGLRVAFSQRQLLLAPYVPGLEAAPSRPGAIKELPGLVRQRRMHHTHHQDPTVLRSIMPHAMIRSIVKGDHFFVPEGTDLASHLKECSSAPRQPQGEVDGRIAATVVQAHLAPGRQKEENHLLRIVVDVWHICRRQILLQQLRGPWHQVARIRVSPARAVELQHIPNALRCFHQIPEAVRIWEPAGAQRDLNLGLCDVETTDGGPRKS